MKELNTDLLIIGAGPAGLAAALKAHEEGLQDIVVVDRDESPGGILQQCIHDGFGLQRFKRRLSGTQYAQRYIDALAGTGCRLFLNTSVLEITPEKTVCACSSDGIMRFNCGAIILAMGCRERTAMQAFIYGSRPAGVMTAGAVQRCINIKGWIPGKRAVILGSGDIGLIMARRMTLEGIEVEGIYEQADYVGGNRRNLKQCVADFGVPLHLSSTVTRVHGKQRLEAVTTVKLDKDKKPIAGTERKVECDLLVLSVGLIPENELSAGLGLEFDPGTGGPRVDENFMTSLNGVFAAGNAVAVMDLADYVSYTGELAAAGAARYLRGELELDTVPADVAFSENIRFVVPQRIRSANHNELPLFMRVCSPEANVELKVTSSGSVISEQALKYVTPPEMLTYVLPAGEHTDIEISVVPQR